MTPQVTCICLTADRQALTDRAVKCFLNQSYPAKHLLIIDNGREPYKLDRTLRIEQLRHITNLRIGKAEEHTVGSLRNLAVGVASSAELIAHWDSDDWSHPLRLAWQIALLKDRKVDLVGYNSMMFWRDGEAWDFRDDRETYMLGTSMLYWRNAWTKHSFREVNRGEDNDWQKQQVRVAVPAWFRDEPAMVASILPDGAGGWYEDDGMTRSTNWSRVPDWDEKIARIMK